MDTTQVKAQPKINVPRFTPAVLRSVESMMNFIDDMKLTLTLINRDMAMDLKVMAANEDKEMIMLDTDLGKRGTRNVKPDESLTRDSGRGVGTGKPKKLSEKVWESDSLNVIKNDPSGLKVAKNAIVQIIEDHNNLKQLRAMRDNLLAAKAAADAMTGSSLAKAVKGFVSALAAVNKDVNALYNTVYKKISQLARNHTPSAMKPWVTSTGGRGLGIEDIMNEYLTFETANKMEFMYVAREGRHLGELVHVVQYRLKDVVDPIDNQPVTLNVTLSYSQGVIYLYVSQKYLFPGNAPLGVVVTKYDKLAAAFESTLRHAGLNPEKSRTTHNYNLYLGLDEKDSIRRHGAKLSDIITNVDFDDDEGRFIVFYLKNTEVDVNMVMTDLKKMATGLLSNFKEGVQWSVKKDTNWKNTGKAVITLSLNNPPYTGVSVKDIAWMQTMLDATDAEMQRFLTLLNDRGYDGSRNVKPKTSPDQKTFTQVMPEKHEGLPELDINDFGQVRQFVEQDVRSNNNITSQPGRSKEQLQTEIIDAVMDWYGSNEITSQDEILGKIDELVESWTGAVN